MDNEFWPLSELFPPVVDANRNKALKILAVWMDANRGMWRASASDKKGNSVHPVKCLMINFKIDPDKNSAVGDSGYRIGRRRTPHFGKIQIDGITLLKAAAEGLWPPTKTSKGMPKRAGHTAERIAKLRIKIGNGKKTETQIRAEIAAEIGPISEDAWRASGKLVPGDKKRAPGRPAKLDNQAAPSVAKKRT